MQAAQPGRKGSPMEVERVAQLAKLRLPPEQKQAMAAQLSSIVDFAGQLAAADTASVEAAGQVGSRETHGGKMPSPMLTGVTSCLRLPLPGKAATSSCRGWWNDGPFIRPCAAAGAAEPGIPAGRSAARCGTPGSRSGKRGTAARAAAPALL